VRRLQDLHQYQIDAAARMVDKRRVACFLEPGLGKTVITLTALQLLHKPRTLVLAPARVADSVWHAEAAAWEHTAGIRVGRATGSPDERAYVLEELRPDVVTLSYENLPWLLTEYRLSKLFDCVVFDELSKMKAAGTGRFRRMRSYIRPIEYRFGLTGTPVGNHLKDIWGEMFMIADEKPLGPSSVEFLTKYFFPTVRVNNVATGWKPYAFAEKEIHERVKPWAFTLSPVAAPALPELRMNRITVPLPPEVAKLSRDLAEDMTVKLASGVDLDALSSATLSTKLRQMAGGAVYTAPGKWEVIHGQKLRALEELREELQGEPLMVGYWFKHEEERILAHFTGVAETLDSPNAIERWNRREIEMLLVHPQSAGHGLNLQHGGHNLCWYTAPWSNELRKQTCGRLIRHGQKSPWVMEHWLLAGDTDALVLGVIENKGAVEDRLLAAMLA
jgi:SNF2 family DNA or RNA helicase